MKSESADKLEKEIYFLQTVLSTAKVNRKTHLCDESLWIAQKKTSTEESSQKMPSLYAHLQVN